MEALRKFGAKKAEVSVVPENPVAARLYESAGFKYTGRVADSSAYMEREL